MATLPDATANLTDQAKAFAEIRSAFHESNGGKLTGLTVSEYLQYPNDMAWEAIVGADEQVDGVTRQLFGEGGVIRQRIAVGDVPAGQLPSA